MLRVAGDSRKLRMRLGLLWLAGAAALRVPHCHHAAAAPGLARFRAATPARAARCVAPRAAADDDWYAVLGVPQDASKAKIKQAYRRLALKSHPDVNKAADAQTAFARIAQAYQVLSDDKARAKYDRTYGMGFGGGGGRSGGAGTGGGYSAPRGRTSSYRPRDPAAAAARAQRWREENPTPDELGDSFGALLGDLASAVGRVVGGGDWLSMLDEIGEMEGPELATLLRSSDTSLLREELESARFVQAELSRRIDRLESEVDADRQDAARWDREALTGAMARSVQRDMQRDMRRRAKKLADARRLRTQAIARQRRISERIDELARGGGAPSGGAYRMGGRRSQTGGGARRREALPSVEDELRRLKRNKGRQ